MATSIDNNKRRKRSSLIVKSTKATPTATVGLVFFLLASSFISFTNAQQPVGSRRVGFTVLNDALYIEGGFDTSSSDQFISLDLSTSWPASSPAWSILKDGQSTSHLALASISTSSNGGPKGSILAIGGMGNPQLPTFFSTYDVNAAKWTNQSSVKPPYNYLEGQAAVSDPNTGLIYIIGGYGNNTFNALSVYNPSAMSMVSQQASSAAASLTDVGAVWLSSRSTILTFGGSRAPPAGVLGLGTSDLNVYDPNTKQWSTMSTSGDVPPARLDHCMASSQDGSKVVVYGGTVDGNVYFNDIYILDVASGKWKQGQSSSVTRTRMACAFHSYQFVAWGGSSGGSRTTMLSNVPVVYNLNNGKWVDSYNAAEVPSKTNVGAVVGGIVAILAIVASVGFFVYRRKKQRRMEREAFHSDSVAAAAAMGSEGGVYEDDNIKVLASPSMEYQHAVDQHGNYVHDNYPLSNMDLGGGVSSGYHLHDGSSPSDIPGSPMNYYGGVAPTPRIQSPPVAYSVSSPAMAMSAASPYHGSATGPYYPGGVSAGSDSPVPATSSSGSNNPFTSPEDYYHPPPTIANSIALSSPGMNPFMTATTAVAASAVTTTYQPNLHRDQQQDPFREQQSQSPPWPQQQTLMMSPTRGARAPQVIPDSSPPATMGYVPPPPPAS